jgi:hypothetical protein
MTITKTLSAIAILSTAIAAPAFARPVHHHARDQHFRAAYNQHNERVYPYSQLQRNTENFGFRGRDPSRIGGENPDLHPSAY